MTNVKYNARKTKHNGNVNTCNFADEVQAVCSMVSTDDFVQSVTIQHGRVPSVVLYSKRQIDDVKAFCFNRTAGSVLGVDKTYNLGKIYVTVSVYRNLSLLRKGTNYPPIFFGPMFIHGNSDFDTFSTFFGQLSARFVDNSFADLRIGSDEEASIRKAVQHFFQGSQVIVCTRHLKENLIRNGHKVSAV